MNDLLSRSFSSSRVGPDANEMPTRLESFFQEVESVKEELKQLEQNDDVSMTTTALLKKAKLIKARLQALDRSNEANRELPDCGPGSSEDRMRATLVNGLKIKLKELMERPFNRRHKMISAAKEEIHERHEIVRDLEKNLMELQQVFLDLAVVMMEPQGEQLDDIERHMASAHWYVRGGSHQLQSTWKLQRNTRRWTCYAIIISIILIILIIIITILIIVLSIRPWKK